MATIIDLLADLLNPNPGQNRLVAPNANGPNYLTQTGLGPEQLARFHQMSGMGGQAAPATSMPQGFAGNSGQPQAPQPDQQQTAAVAPPQASGGGFLSRLFGGGQSDGENQTIQWLQQQGMDPGTATMMAKSKPILQQYLLKRSQGVDPKDALQAEKLGLEIENLRHPQAGSDWSKMDDGRLFNQKTGEIRDVGQPEGGGQTITMSPEEVEAAGLPAGVYQKDKEGKISAVGSVRDQDAGFKNEMELRKEYDLLPEVKDYKVVRSNYERIQQGVKLGTGAGDAAIVFGYMKMLDPTSVVREGEQATAANAAGVPEAIRGMYNQVRGEGQLSAEARQQILGAAEKVYGESVGNIEDVNKRYGEYASTWKLDPSRIVATPEQYEPLAPQAPALPAGLPQPPAAMAPAGPAGAPIPNRFAPDIPTGPGGSIAPSADGWRPVAPGVKIRRVN